MKYWCFNEEQLERALQSWFERRGRGQAYNGIQAVRAFLASDEARDNKLTIPNSRAAWIASTPTGTLDPRDDAEGSADPWRRGLASAVARLMRAIGRALMAMAERRERRRRA